MIPPPMTFSTAATQACRQVTGTIDGVNDMLFLPFPVRRAEVFRGGQKLTLNLDVIHGGATLKFFGPHIPQPGDVITVDGWL